MFITLTKIFNFIFQATTEPSVAAHSVSPSLMYGFRPLTGSTPGNANGRIRSTSPTYANPVTAPLSASTNSYASATSAAPPQYSRPRPTGAPTRKRKPKQQQNKRKKRKNFLTSMFESIMRPWNAMVKG